MDSLRLNKKSPLPVSILVLVQQNWYKFRYGILLLCFFAGLLVFMRWALPVVIQPRLNAFFAIEKVQVSGKIEFAPSAEIYKVLQIHIQDLALYQVDVDELGQSLAKIPWIENVAIERVWPHELLVNIEETVPIAIWNNSNILSNRGDLFEPQDIESHRELPGLIGEPTQVSLVTDMYRQASKILRQASLRLIEIEYEKGLVWNLKLEDKTRKDIEFTLVLDGEKSVSRLYRFVEHYPSLSRMDQVPERVDLRYPTGMAVSWSEEKNE
jgi:cell division protein FtsQ